jgi:hypothetical protein
MAGADKRKGCAEVAEGAPEPLWKRLAWFAGLWAAGVLAVGALGYGLRWWLHP